MIKRLVAIIFFLSLMGIASRVDLRALSDYVLPICGIGIAGLLAYAFYHIKCVRKSSLFCIAILAAVFLLPAITLAAETNPVQEDIDAIEKARPQLCSASTNVDSYDPKLLSLAHDVVDRSKKVQAAGSSITGGNIGTTLKCATKYISTATALSGVMSPSCNPLRMLLRQSIEGDDACWPCNVTRVVIDSMQRLAVNAYEPMRNIAIGMMGLIFLFWIAIRVTLFFGQMGFARIGEFFTHMLQQMLIVMVLSAILYGPVVQFYRMTISPFIITSAAVAQRLSSLSEDVSGIDKTPIGKIIHVLDKVNLGGALKCKYCQKMNQTNAYAVGQTFLDEGAVNAALCMICTVYKQVSPFVELGKTLSCLGTAIPKLTEGMPGFSTNSMFAMANMNWVILGWLFVIVFSLFMFSIAFYLINIFMELAFALIFTPVFVMCLAFKITRPYAKKAWELILHAMSVLIGLAVAINLAMVIFAQMLPGSIGTMVIGLFTSGTPTTILNTFSIAAGTGPGDMNISTEGGFEGLLSAIPGISSLVGGATTGTSFFTVLLLLGFITMGFSVVNASVKMAEALSNTQGISSPDDMTSSLLIGAAAGLAALKGGMKATKAIAGIAKGKKNKQEEEKKKKKNPNDPSETTQPPT